MYFLLHSTVKRFNRPRSGRNPKDMNGRYATLVAILILTLFSFSALAGEIAQGNSPASQSLGNPMNHLMSNNEPPGFLKDAFFPKEPRLEDVQPLSGFAPAGIASYGSNGSIVQTNSVRGITTVNDIGVGFFSAELVNNSIAIPYFGSGNASLQENSVLWLSNRQQAYWTQNVVLITESSSSSYVLQLVNNIWNFTSLSSNISPSGVSGTGSVFCERLNGIASCAYITAGPTFIGIAPPFTISLTMTLGGTNGGGADVKFSYQIQDSIGHNYTGQYDDATLLPGHPVESSQYFQIGGESPVAETLYGGTTTLTLPSDLELVFGGPGSGSSVFVNSISGSQELLYYNGTSYVTVPDAYSVGSDTGEQASGIAVTPNLANSFLPSSNLNTGFISSQKLWPVPVTFIVSGDYNEVSSGYLDLQGVALYSTNAASNTAVQPTMSLPVQESASGTSKVTNTNGGFDFPFKPTHTGTYHDNIYYSGSVAFEKGNMSVQIAVSSINLVGANGGLVIASFNSSQSVIQNKSTILVPVLQGTTIVVTFQNVSYSGNQKEQFLGFSSQNSVVLNGNGPQNVTANFSQQPSATLLTSILFYGVVGAITLVVGVILGYVIWGRKSDTLLVGP